MNFFRNIYIFLILTLCLSACVAQWQKNEDASHISLKFQNRSTNPNNGIKFIDESQLRPGDILFSAESSLTSVGIRLFNQSPISHSFLYMGDGLVSEAVGGGVLITPLSQYIDDSIILFAYRHPDLTEQDFQKIQAYANLLKGSKYNFFGIAKQMPYSITRNICELPVIPRSMRHLCLNTIAMAFITPFSGKRVFCSQYVIEAFNQAGKPLTNLPSGWVTPTDIMHMREDDIPAISSNIKLEYVGHIKCDPTPLVSRCRPANEINSYSYINERLIK